MYINIDMKIIKNTREEPSGLIQQNSEHHAVSFIAKGEKTVYDTESTVTAHAGDLLYTPAGRNCVDIRPDKSNQFEEISVHIAPGDLSRYMKILCADLNLQIRTHYACKQCKDGKYIVCKAGREMRAFFASLGSFFHSNADVSPAMESLKIMEMLALLAQNPISCIQHRLFSDGDAQTESFESIVRANIFTGVTINQLAEKTNRSITAFKNEFMRLFHEPPHQWILRQRLAYARTLIVTTDRQINDIAVECAMCNASHFVRVFREAFDMPPAEYRKRHGRNAKKEWA